jgi:hypothetical protein
MPRNSSGTYSLPIGTNPVVAATSISTGWANGTLSDIANELTNSLDRNGKGGMLAAFKNASGTVSAPGITWADETDSGWYRNAANDIRAAINGVDATKHRDDTGTGAGSQSPFQIWDGSAFYNPLTGGDGSTPAFTTLTSAGAVTVTAGGLTVTTGGATIAAGGATITGTVDVDGDLGISGSYTLDYPPPGLAYGVVVGNGTLVVNTGITSVTRTGTGTYEVYFDGNIAGGPTPACVVKALDSSQVTAMVVGTTTTDQVDVRTVNASSGAAVDADFSVIGYTYV